MSYSKVYADYSDEQLVHAVENDGYTPAAKKTAKRILKQRGVSDSELTEHAKTYFHGFFREQFGRPLLKSVPESGLPKSEYLTIAELKAVAKRAYDETLKDRGDFYSSLPM